MAKFLTHKDVEQLKCCKNAIGPVEIQQDDASQSVKSKDDRILLVDELQKAKLNCGASAKNLPPCAMIFVIPSIPSGTTINGKTPVLDTDIILTNNGPCEKITASSAVEIVPGVLIDSLDEICKPQKYSDEPKEIADGETVQVTLLCHINMIPISNIPFLNGCKWQLWIKEEYDNSIVFSEIKGAPDECNFITSGTTQSDGKLTFQLPILSFFKNWTIVLEVKYGPLVFRRPVRASLLSISNRDIYCNYLDDGYHWILPNDPPLKIRENVSLPVIKSESLTCVTIDSLPITFPLVQKDKPKSERKQEDINVNFWLPSVDAHSHIILTYYKKDLSLPLLGGNQSWLEYLGMAGALGFFLNEPRENIDTLNEGYEDQPGIRHNKLDSLIGIPLILDGAYTAVYALSPETNKKFPNLIVRIGEVAISGKFDQTVTDTDVLTCPARLRDYYPDPVEGAPYCFSKASTDEPDPDLEKTLRGTLDAYALMAERFHGKILPFLPFEPRRHNSLDILKKYYEKKTGNSSPLFAGVKIYTRNGWLLEDNNRFYPEETAKALDCRINEFLKYCDERAIPITNHHSPGGFPESPFLVPPIGCVKTGTEWSKNKKENCWVEGFPPPPEKASDFEWLAWLSFAEVAMKIRYIQATSAPMIWEKALHCHKNINVCLAHGISEVGVLCMFFKESHPSCFMKLFKRLIGSGKIDQCIETLACMGGGDLFSELFCFVVKERLKTLSVWLSDMGQVVCKHYVSDFAYPFAKTIIDGWRSFITEKVNDGFARAIAECRTGRICSPITPQTFEVKCRELHMHPINEIFDLNKSWVSAWKKVGDYWRNCPWIKEKKAEQDWLNQSLSLRGKYGRVYLDCSFFSNSMDFEYQSAKSKEKDITNLIDDPEVLSLFLCEKFVSEFFHPKTRLQDHLMFGTDWGVTTPSGISATDNWRFFHEAFFNNRFAQNWNINERDVAWEKFTSSNALRFLFEKE